MEDITGLLMNGKVLEEREDDNIGEGIISDECTREEKEARDLCTN